MVTTKQCIKLLVHVKINIGSSSVMSRVLMRLERVTRSWLTNRTQGSRKSLTQNSHASLELLMSTRDVTLELYCISVQFQKIPNSDIANFAI